MSDHLEKDENTQCTITLKVVIIEEISSNRNVRQVMGPIFNLVPPVLNSNCDESEGYQSEGNSDFEDIVKIQAEDLALLTEDQLEEYYSDLISEIKSSKIILSKKQPYMLAAVRISVQINLKLQADGQFRKAITCLDRCTKQFIIRDPYLLVYLQFKYVECFIESFQLNRAVDMLKICIIELEKQQWEVYLGDALHILGQIYSYYQMHDDAQKLFNHALELYEKHISKKDTRVALVKNSSAFMAYIKKEYPQAETLYLQAIQILETGNNSKMDPSVRQLAKMQAQNGLGIVTHQIGQGSKSAAIFQQALSACEDNKRYALQLGKIHQNLGSVHKVNGDYQSSMLNLHHALAIFKDILPSWHSSMKKIQHEQNFLNTQIKSKLSV